VLERAGHVNERGRPGGRPFHDKSVRAMLGGLRRAQRAAYIRSRAPLWAQEVKR
jgi:hypothetical protein